MLQASIYKTDNLRSVLLWWKQNKTRQNEALLEELLPEH